MATGDFFELSSVSRTGFTITFLASGGTIVDRNFDYQAVGHGKGDHLMAQATDYSLANQRAVHSVLSSTRSLGAVQTLNSGSSAPSNLVAHMVFLDTSTTPATLKITQCRKRRVYHPWNSIDQLRPGQCLWRDVYG